MKEIKVYDITGSRAILDTPDGDILFKLLNNFKNGHIATLDFEKVDTILSMFLNSAIAPLYEIYDSDFLKQHLIIKNMPDEDKMTLKKVNSGAKQFYKEAKENANLRMRDVYGSNIIDANALNLQPTDMLL